MNESPRYGRAFAVSLLNFVIFCGVFAVAAAIASLILLLIDKIPIVNRLLWWLISFQGNTPSSLAVTVGCIAGGILVSQISEKLNPHEKADFVSRILTGSYLAVIAIIWFIVAIAAALPFVQFLPIISFVVFGVLSVMFLR